VPESNLVFALNTGVLHAAQVKVPARFSFRSSDVNGRSVACLYKTLKAWCDNVPASAHMSVRTHAHTNMYTQTHKDKDKDTDIGHGVKKTRTRTRTIVQ
jgi:hypothetical protein